MTALVNSLKIIGGRWRSRKLSFPKNKELRPTPARVRETLFNWLTPVITNARCLDLFCGSGILGIEALSRGASGVVFVDHHHPSTKQLTVHLQQLQSTDNAEVITANSLRWLQQPPAQPFDVVFLDPPFHQNLLAPACQLLTNNGFLQAGTFVYVEAESNYDLILPAAWHRHREQTAGQVKYQLLTIN